MQPGAYDLNTYQGDTARWLMTFRENVDGVSGDPIDLTGYVGKAQIRSEPSSTVVVVEMSVSLSNQTTNPGEVTITAPASQTANLVLEEYVWDLQFTMPSGDVQTFLAGKVNNTLQVTR